jgi:uncharacterized protein YndB with AHSA1/START domain
VWSAITDPSRLARWYGEVEGDLRLGGEFRARLFASGWEGTGRVEACEPPRHLMLLTKDPDQADEGVIEITLSADGDQTILVCEERSMPLHLLAAYGAGIQVHAEDLAAHLAGRQRCDPKAVGRAHPCLSRPGSQPRLAIAPDGTCSPPPATIGRCAYGLLRAPRWVTMLRLEAGASDRALSP